MKRSNRNSGLILLSMLCVGCASIPGGGGPGLRILSYNIHAGKDAAQQHNLERVSQVIRDAAADIVFLQEVDRRTQRAAGEDHVETLAKLTGMHVAFGKSLDYQGGDYGIAILSRFPLDSVQVVPLQVQPPQDRSGSMNEPRIGLYAIARTPQGAVHLLNTHIDPAPETTYRHQEIVRLLAFARRHAEHATLVFGGDLNARPDTPEIAAVSLAFADSWARCGNGGPGFTFPAHAPDRRIDYLMLRRARCTSARVVETQASDHRPLLVTIEIED